MTTLMPAKSLLKFTYQQLWSASRYPERSSKEEAAKEYAEHMEKLFDAKCDGESAHETESFDLFWKVLHKKLEEMHNGEV